MRKFLFLFEALICLGCGGAGDGQLFGQGVTNTTGGTGGGISTSSSISSSISSSSSTTSSSQSSTSSSSGCMPKVTCQSIGAECGVIMNDGCGNSIDCGDNCVLPMTCGGGQDQFKCGCTSKTCAQQNKNCGIADDTCGNVLNCGTCNPIDYQTTCGDYGWYPGGTIYHTQIQNVCGGGCEKLAPLMSSGICNNPSYSIEWQCNANAIANTHTAPDTNCIEVGTSAWCCQ